MGVGDDRPGARELYEKVLLNDEPPDTELYDKPFAEVRKQVLKTLQEVPTAIGYRDSKLDLSAIRERQARIFTDVGAPGILDLRRVRTVQQ